MNLINILEELIEEGEKLAPQGGQQFEGYNDKMQPEYVSWRLQSLSAIRELGQESKFLLHDIEEDKASPYFFESSAKIIIGTLKGALGIIKNRSKSSKNESNDSRPLAQKKTNEIFVVHGHDITLLHQVARFLEQIEIKPIILFEQPGKGQTIIEKIENNSSVSYAVVLFTPDDIGKAAKGEESYKPRARQNVVLELGYFIGKLGRQNVGVLYDESVELPSDYHGVEYIAIDVSGAWKMRLAKEIKSAGITIDMNKAI